MTDATRRGRTENGGGRGVGETRRPGVAVATVAVVLSVEQQPCSAVREDDGRGVEVLQAGARKKMNLDNGGLERCRDVTRAKHRDVGSAPADADAGAGARWQTFDERQPAPKSIARIARTTHAPPVHPR